MSGGHFDYDCFRISSFAEKLKHEIDINDSEEKNEFGYQKGHKFEKETMARLVVSRQIIETAAKLAREIEWLYSGDHSEESFNHLADRILAGLE